MRSLAHRIAARFIAAGIADEFEHRFEKLLDMPSPGPSPEDVRAFSKWMQETFKLSGRAPKEVKNYQISLESFRRRLDSYAKSLEDHIRSPSMSSIAPFPGWFANDRQWMKLNLPLLVQHFTTEGTGKKIPTVEKTVGANTYTNNVGASEKRFDEMIALIEGVFAGLKGWRKGALEGGVRVLFMGPQDFHGTASGTYKSLIDQLWIRATTGGRIQKYGDGYGGLAYVITHELGHRYERKHHLPVNFDQSDWLTTRYSHNEGESFAELFALSNFGITNQGGAEILPRFESLMETGKIPPPLPMRPYR